MSNTWLLKMASKRKEFMKRYKIYKLKLDNVSYSTRPEATEYDKFIIY